MDEALVGALRALRWAGLVASVVAVGMITPTIFPRRTPDRLIGPADIMKNLQTFYGTRSMGHGYRGPVVWVDVNGWQALTPDQLASLPSRAGGYPCIPIEQVSAQGYFDEYGYWPQAPTDDQVKQQFMHLCDWQRERGFATVPCEDLKP